MENFDKPTPIPVINNTHIELTRIVKYKGELCSAKMLMYIADIRDIEAGKTKDDDKPCTKINATNGFFKVRESYKKLKETWLTWLEWAKTYDEKEKED